MPPTHCPGSRGNSTRLRSACPSSGAPFGASVAPAQLGAQGQIVSQAAFEEPVHKYDSVEVTANKTFSNNWSLVASYRWSRLKGLYEGAVKMDRAKQDRAHAPKWMGSAV